jgi:hypothetical protein
MIRTPGISVFVTGIEDIQGSDHLLFNQMRQCIMRGQTKARRVPLREQVSK